MKESEQNKEKTAKDETSHIIPRFGKKGPSKLRQSFSRGMTYFLVVAACIVLYFAFLRADILADSVRTVIGILKPIIYGFAIAYLLNPIVKRHLIPESRPDSRPHILLYTRHLVSKCVISRIMPSLDI